MHAAFTCRTTCVSVSGAGSNGASTTRIFAMPSLIDSLREEYIELNRLCKVGKQRCSAAMKSYLGSGTIARRIIVEVAIVKDLLDGLPKQNNVPSTRICSIFKSNLTSIK